MNISEQVCTLEQAKRLKELVEWRDVVEYEGLYKISESGVIKSAKRTGSKGGVLKQYPDRGYLIVYLSKNNKIKRLAVHRLVAAAFNYESKHLGNVVNHFDGNRENNHYSNLIWGTRLENENHKKTVLGSSNIGNRNPNFKRGKGLLYPTYDQTKKLVTLGVPRWAVRLDWLGVMLPDYAISYKAGVNGWMGSIKQGNGDMSIGGKTEAQARAAMLIRLLEQNLISVTDVNSRLC